MKSSIHSIRALGSALAVAFVVACGEKVDPFQSNTGLVAEDEVVTYESHVRQILEDHCTACHASDQSGTEREGAPEDVNLDTYENVVRHAERANLRIQSDTMPPGGGALSDRERALFQAWIDQGMQEGEPGDGTTPTPGATPTAAATRTPTAAPTPTQPPTPAPDEPLVPLPVPDLFATATPTATPTPAPRVTYEDDVRFFLDAKCVSCHDSQKAGSARNGAPENVNLDTYEAAVAHADRANARIQADTMPPGGGQVTNDERGMFQRWIDQGTPRGGE